GERAARGVRALRREDPPVVPVEGRLLRAVRRQGLFEGRQLGPRGARLLALRGLPVEPVLLARRAQDLLRELADAVPVPVLLLVGDLGVDVGEADADRLHLVLPDAPREQFL